MKTSRLFLPPRLLLLLVLVAAAGCTTLGYRTVQTQFQDTVRADNERFTIPFTDVTSGYQSVATQLTPEYINGLDPKLRPNAWTLRAVSQWRAEESSNAVASSVEGLAEISRQKEQVPKIENS